MFDLCLMEESGFASEVDFVVVSVLRRLWLMMEVEVECFVFDLMWRLLAVVVECFVFDLILMQRLLMLMVVEVAVGLSFGVAVESAFGLLFVVADLSSDLMLHLMSDFVFVRLLGSAAAVGSVSELEKVGSEADSAVSGFVVDSAVSGSEAEELRAGLAASGSPLGSEADFVVSESLMLPVSLMSDFV